MFEPQTLPEPRSGRRFNAEDATASDELVAHLQDIVAILLEKNERLRQQLFAYGSEATTP